MFIDYEYYSANSSAGSLIPAEDFPTIEAEVERFLKYVTQGKYSLVTDLATVSAVKTALCVAADSLYALNQEFKDIPSGIASESTDGHSVTFVKSDASKMAQQRKRLMYDAFVQELFDTGLLYQGVS